MKDEGADFIGVCGYGRGFVQLMGSTNKARAVAAIRDALAGLVLLVVHALVAGCCLDRSR